jgi:hypothetical protein
MAQSTADSPAGTDSAEDLYDENGVDLSLVRYTLKLTPTERLKAVENFMNAMATVKHLPSPVDDDATDSSER